MKKGKKRRFRLRFNIEKELPKALFDKLSKSDLKWFKEHSTAWYRIRPYEEGEFHMKLPIENGVVCVVRIHKYYQLRSVVDAERGKWLEEGGDEQDEELQRFVRDMGGPENFRDMEEEE